MKKEKFINYFSFGIMVIAILIFSIPKEVKATEDGKRYLGTTCQGPDYEWRCNNCIAGSSTCGDNTCWDCLPPVED
jgi:hypothetical protein